MGCNACKHKTGVIVKTKRLETLPVDSPEKLAIRSSTFVFHKTSSLLIDYEIGPLLGSGAFGCVRTAVHKATGQERAIKTVKKEKVCKDMQARSRFFTEIDVLRQINHPNILQLFEFYEDAKSFHLVTERLYGGELFEYIVSSEVLSESIAAHFMRQVLSAINYCHKKGIIHRDLKPENLLLDKRSPTALIKIIDFGASALFNESEKLKARFGTSYYIAPEVLRRSYDEKCDLWSCGVILYILLSGRPPFPGRNDEEILNRVKKGVFYLTGPEWEPISPEAKDLITKLLEFNPTKRLSAEESLNHPWFSLNIQEKPSQIPQNILENLKSLRANEKLQHAVLTFISSQLNSKEEIRRQSEIFKSIDKNGDGKLSREELKEEFLKTMNEDEALNEVEKILCLVDLDQNGFIDYSEFLTASLKKETIMNKRNLEFVFKMFDIDGSGAISADEIKKILGEDVVAADGVWREIISKVDQDGDGQIDLKEFKDMMMKVAEL